MNPVYKNIPVLIRNGKQVCESLIIVQHIDEMWKDKAPLLPSDLYGRTHSIICVEFVDKKKAWIYTFRYAISLIPL